MSDVLVIQVQDLLNSIASASFTIPVSALPLPTITTASLAQASVGAAYSFGMTATGGTTPYTWQVGSSSGANTWSFSGNNLVGTPTTGETDAITIAVIDANSRPAFKAFSLVVTSGVSITTTSPLPNATQSSAYSDTMAAVGGVLPYTWSKVSQTGTNTWAVSAAGVVTGTPSTAEADTITIKVTDSTTPTAQSAQGTFSLTVNALPVTATPTFNPVAGTYSGAQSVSILDATGGASIFYTTNGTTPTTGSTPYTGAISVAASETIKAIATAAGHTQSAVASASYTINSGTGPSAPTTLQLLSQGRNTSAAGGNPGNPVPDNANRQILGWVQATPQAGTTIVSNRVYVTIDGGTENILATFPATTTYTDSAATGCLGATATPHNAQGQSWPAAHGYLYRVSAIDSNSVEGPKSDYQIFIYYLNGVQYATAGDFNSGMTTNYHNAITGSPFGSTQDILNTPNSGGGQWLPWAGNHATCYNIWVGSGAPTQVFKYLNISLKPTATSQQITAWVEFRTDTNGDPTSGTRSVTIPGGTGVISGPNPMVAGQWNTYKLLLADMMFDNGTNTLQGMWYKLGLNQVAGALTAYEVDNIFLSVS